MRKLLQKFATSIYFDILGVALVMCVAISFGYLNTRLDKYVDWGTWTAYVPFGIISVVNVGISMLSTRFTGKLNAVGNVFGIVNAVITGVIDYILGNKAAIITYPATFIIYSIAIYKWQKSESGKANSLSTQRIRIIIPILIAVSFAFSIIANYIGFSGQITILSVTTTLTFALSLVANCLNAFKVTTQWHFWLVYNFIQIVKAVTQGNFANVGKYIFYVINCVGATFVWSDSTKE